MMYKVLTNGFACHAAIFDRIGRYVITGSDDRLVKIWSTETALCLASCRGHEVSNYCPCDLQILGFYLKYWLHCYFFCNSI